MALTFSRTSLAASCTLRSSTKVAKTCDWPSMELERSSSRPAMVLTASSMVLVIWLSISSGEAPGRRVVMVMVGRSTLGKMSTPSCAKEARPEHHERGDQHGGEDRPADEDLQQAHFTAVTDGDGGTVVEGGEIRGGDRLSRLHALEDLQGGALANSWPDLPFLGLAVGDHEHLVEADHVHQCVGRARPPRSDPRG